MSRRCGIASLLIALILVAGCAAAPAWGCQHECTERAEGEMIVPRSIYVLLLVFANLAVASAALADTHSVCLYLPIHSVDRDIGEDFHTSGFSYEGAHGVQLRVFRGGMEVYEGNVNENGCRVLPRLHGRFKNG